jgi:HSP20 family protein
MTESKEIEATEAEKQELAESGAERTRAQRAFVPRVDIYETEQAIALVADMPGVDAGSVDISLEQNVLTITGYVTERRPEGYTLTYAEYRTGDYVRSFTLSNQIDQGRIRAAVKDGVLRLHLPKVQPTSTKITVTAG